MSIEQLLRKQEAEINRLRADKAELMVALEWFLRLESHIKDGVALHIDFARAAIARAKTDQLTKIIC